MVEPKTAKSPLYARAHELDQQVRRLGLRRRRDKAALAMALLEIKEKDLFRLLGYRSMTAYGRTVEGLGASCTSELLKIAQGCRQLPQVREAFESGRLSASKASVVVDAATPETEGEWLEQARTLDPSALRAVQRGEEPRLRQVLKLDPNLMAWVDDAVRAVRESGGPSDFSRALAEVCRRFVQGEALGTGKAPGSKRGVRPILVLTQGPDGTTTRESSRGTVVVDAETEAWARREGTVVDLKAELAARRRQDEDAHGGDDPGETDLARPPSRAIPRAVRRLVEARDQGRCQLPGCASRTFLEADHLDGWKRGHDPERIALLCSSHHRARTLGYLKVGSGQDGRVRFLLQDGTELGLAGDRVRADLLETPSASREFVDTKPQPQELVDRKPQPSKQTSALRDFVGAKHSAEPPAVARSGERKKTPSGPPRPQPHPGSPGWASEAEHEDALLTMIALEVRPTRARALLERTLKEDPSLWRARAPELVRAMLVRLRGPGDTTRRTSA
jgi:hypothetical protein